MHIFVLRYALLGVVGIWYSMMREGWNRATPVFSLSCAEAEQLLRPAFPSARVLQVEETSGGLANTNLKIYLENKPPQLLRFCVRDPNSAAREFRLLSISSDIPVPHVTTFSQNNPINGYPFIVMDWVDGVRLETIIGSLTHEEIAVLGRSIGKTLSAIHAVRFNQSGFLDENLSVVTPIESGSKGYLSYVNDCLQNNLVISRLGESIERALALFLNRNSEILDEWLGAPCLAHCDFNPSNILVNKNAGFWKVVAVLDWEFALSATPFFDFGNLLRPPFGELPGIEDAISQGYTESGGILPPNWRKISKLTDLTAWLDFLTRETAGPQLISDCNAQIMKTIEQW